MDLASVAAGVPGHPVNHLLGGAVALLSCGVMVGLLAAWYWWNQVQGRKQDPGWDRLDIRERSRDSGGRVSGYLISGNQIGPYLKLVSAAMLAVGCALLVASAVTDG